GGVRSPTMHRNPTLFSGDDSSIGSNRWRTLPGPHCKRQDRCARNHGRYVVTGMRSRVPRNPIFIVSESTMATEKKFASQADLEEKKVSFDKLSDNAYAYT